LSAPNIEGDAAGQEMEYTLSNLLLCGVQSIFAPLGAVECVYESVQRSRSSDGRTASYNVLSHMNCRFAMLLIERRLGPHNLCRADPPVQPQDQWCKFYSSSD
jgi:hypothetical protein